MTVACATALLPRLAAAPPDPVGRDTRGWIPATHAAQPVVKGSALDVSFLLDAPAGRHGFVIVKGDHFVFADGTPARFWGGNFFGEANFPEKADAERLADIVARSGANIVRMHHLDVVAPWTDKVVKRSLFGGQQPETTRRLDPAMLDRLEYLVHCFKQRGIYIFLSPTSSRMVRPGDGFPGPADAANEIGWGLKFEGMFDPFLIELQEEYLRTLLTHRNPYTGLALVDDPVLAMTEVINENSTIWPQDEGPFALTTDYYRTMLRTQFNAWLRDTIGNRAALATRWAAPGRKGLGDDEDPATSTVAIPAGYRDQARYGFSDARVTDTFGFLADLQSRYFRRMRAFIKGLGLHAPLTGSNHWTDDVVDLRQNADFDYVDRHDYWTHPEGSYNYEQGQRIDPKAMVHDPTGGIIGRLARRRVAGKPYTVSEWHHCLPNPFRAEGPILAAAYGALQGWHPMQYAYWAVTETAPPMINSFETMFDPTQTNLQPAAALLFARGDVREATAPYYEPIAADAVLNPLSRPSLNPALALFTKYGISFADVPIVPGAPRPALPGPAGSDGTVRSSTGELGWNATRGLVTVDTPATQAVVGFAGGTRVGTKDVVFDITTPFAVVVVSSLTKDPIASSSRLLVSTSADARWTGADMSARGDEVLSTGHWPFLMQPVEGLVTLPGAGPLTVYRLDTDGARLGALAVTTTADGRVVLPLAAANGAMHYEIVRGR